MMKFLWILLLAALIGGAIVLSMWGIPAPTTRVEKVIKYEE